MSLRKRSVLRTIVSAASAIIACPALSHGQSISGTWLNINPGSWSDATNWNSLSAPDGGGEVTFNYAVGSGSIGINNSGVALDTAVTLSTIHFGAIPAVIIYGSGTMTLTGPALFDVSASIQTSFDTAAAGDAFHVHLAEGHKIGTSITGSGGIRKTGSGVLTLAGTSTFSGGLTVEGGTLRLDSDAAAGDASNAIELNGASLTFRTDVATNRAIVLGAGGGTLRMNAAVFDGLISGAGSLSMQLCQWSGTSLTAANTFHGPLTVIGCGFTNYGIPTVQSTLKFSGAHGSVQTDQIVVTSGTIDLDNSAVTNVNRISDFANVRLASSSLRLLSAGTGSIDEQAGTLTLTGGVGSVIVQSGADHLSFSHLARENRALGSLSPHVMLGNGISLLAGAGGVAGTDMVSIVPFMVGDGAVYTYDSANGMRPLVDGFEYANAMPPAGETGKNVRIAADATTNTLVDINSLSFTGTNHVISGAGTIAVASGLITSQQSNTIQTPIDFGDAEGIVHGPDAAKTTNVLAISGSIGGSNGLTISGSGVELSGNSTYVGATTVHGLLRLGTSVPASGSGPLGSDTSPVVLAGPSAKITGGGTIALGRDLVVPVVGSPDHFTVPAIGGTLTISGNIQLDAWIRIAGAPVINGNISGPGGINMVDRADTSVSNTLTLTGNNSFHGGIEATEGTILIGSGHALGDGSLRIGGRAFKGLRLVASGAPRIIDNPVVLMGWIGLRGTQSLTLAGPFDLNGMLIDRVWSCGIDGPRDGEPMATISGSVSNGIFVLNSGAVLLSGNNSQFATAISGTMRIESDNGLGCSPVFTRVSGTNAALELNNGVNIPSHLFEFWAAGKLTSISGTNTWNGSVKSYTTSTFDIQADTLRIMGQIAAGTTDLTKSGVGTLELGNLRANTLNITGGQVHVRPSRSDAGTSRFTSLTIDNGAQLDLSDNDLVIDYTGTSPIDSVRQMLQSKRLIASSAGADDALGYSENTAGLLTFGGQPADATSVLVHYTYAGDANFDGRVDASDLGALALSWASTGMWAQGDFNYDGIVDVGDLYILAIHWQKGVSGGPAVPLDKAIEALGLPPISVPEPTAMFGLSMLAMSLMRRRCRANPRQYLQSR